MKRRLLSAVSIFVAICILIGTTISFCSAAAISTSARNGAILICADTGEVIYEQNADTVAPMASTTKIMTALLALESGDLDSYFTVDPTAIKVEGSSMGLKEGDQVTMRTLVYGMLLPSGNDAANAAAVKIAGSIENFVAMMNQRAQQIGMKSTVFATPSGLDKGVEHYSTARDMAILAMEALKNPEFVSICSQSSAKLEYGNPPYQRWLKNHNRLLKEYEGCYGVKTGFTKEAGRCLVSAAERDGKKLIAVVLNDSQDWSDSKSLFDYGFSVTQNYLPKTDLSQISIDVVGGEETTVGVTMKGIPQFAVTPNSQQQIEEIIKTDPFYYAPIKEGDVLGSICYKLNGQIVAEEPIYANKTVGQNKSFDEGKFSLGDKLQKRINNLLKTISAIL